MHHNKSSFGMEKCEASIRIRLTGAKHSNPKPPNNPRWPHLQDVPQETLHPTRTGYIHSTNREAPLQDIANNPVLYNSSVIYTKKRFVLVKDRTRQASVRLLLLPRDKSRYELHPLTAYSDPLFRAQV